MSTAATDVATATLLKQPATAQEKTSALPAMVSGPHLSEAVQEATAAADAEMVPVPLSQQHATVLPGPGINGAALHASEVPAQEGGALPSAGTASLLAVASATTMAAAWCADAGGHSSVSAVTASTTTAIAVLAGKKSDLYAANERPATSDVVMRGKSPAGLVNVMASSTLADAVSASAAGKAEDATAVQSMQAAPPDRQQCTANGQAGSRGDVESCQLSSFTSQQYAAGEETDDRIDAASSPLSSVDSQQMGPEFSDGSSEQQGGAATDDGPWSSLAEGKQAAGGRDGNEDESSLMMPGSSMSLGPNVKQSVRRLEQIHAAMRNGA